MPPWVEVEVEGSGRGRGGEGRRQVLRDRLHIIRTCVNLRAVLHTKGAIGNIWGNI